MGRTGSADLPLHGGRVPEWLASRMARLGSVMVEALVLEESPHGVLRRLAHPFWFQALGCVMGMDWHSSGITTSVLGQDGFDLYLHGFVVANDGAWTVVQQGMNTGRRQARRYHWLSEGVRSFVEEPHAAIEGRPLGEVVNLTDRRAAASREATLELSRDPERVLHELPRLRMPAHHDVRKSDVFLRRLHGTLAAARDAGPRDFPQLLLQPGVGARTVEALAAVAEVLHGAPCRFRDPARFSLAHGGKDGHPFPVPLRVYDRTISVLKQAVSAARLGRTEKIDAIRRLDEQARRLESNATGPQLEEHIEVERAHSHEYGGRDVSGPAQPENKQQLSLFSAS